MLNMQRPLPVDRDKEGFVNVHSIFKTIQGEGPFAGHAAVFIRLYGCNLQCPHCDTEYTNYRNNMSALHVAQEIIAAYNPRPTDNPLVVITGGEPFRQNIGPLVDFLLAYLFTVQIETNGVLYPGDDFPWDDPNLWVVCSPKTGKIHPKLAKRADAYKYVLSYDGVAEDGLPTSALGHPLGDYKTVARPPDGWKGSIYLNPMDAGDEANERNITAVTKSVLEHRKYILGVQMHKLIGLP